jgi:hypothetical protein
MRLLLALAAAALAACSPPAPARYPPQYETAFMRGCEGQNPAPGVCACIWDRIEAEVTPDAFAALDRMPAQQRQAHPLMQQINGYALACQSSLRPAMEPPPSP